MKNIIIGCPYHLQCKPGVECETVKKANNILELKGYLFAVSRLYECQMQHRFPIKEEVEEIGT